MEPISGKLQIDQIDCVQTAGLEHLPSHQRRSF